MIAEFPHTLSGVPYVLNNGFLITVLYTWTANKNEKAIMGNKTHNMRNE
jgi:hypothetical protein